MAQAFSASSASAKRSRIRPRPLSASAMAFNAAELSRGQALLLIQDAAYALPLSGDIQRLISIFQVGGEELSELGVPYETLKAMERRHPLAFSLTRAF
ncbi:MAG: hypothetical protein IPK79_01780 [Vampirovibrionales bacterium]|nr:hypothetical protein [Vampirovibrionales bacterium]